MLEGKVIVIAGAAGLIGKQFSRAVVENGGTCIVADFNEEAGRKVCLELGRDNKWGEAIFYKLDITSKESIDDLIQSVRDKYGRIDAIVNTAYPRGRNFGRAFFEVEYEDFCENVNLQLGGYFLSSQRFADFFCKQGWGNIVNLASIYGVVPPRYEIYENTQMTGSVEYAAIKSALVMLTKFMAKTLKGKNIRVNTISPGGVLDNQPESFLQKYREQCLNKGMLEPDDLTGTLIYLLSDMSAYVNGQNIIVDDGFTL